jgi:hypothetical protein
MPVTPMGFRPPELSPHRQAWTLFQGPMPSCRWPPRNGSTSGPLAGGESVASTPLFRKRRSPLLSWAFILFRVFPFFAMEPRKGSSSHELSHTRLSVPNVRVLQSFAQRKNRLGSLELAYPPEVSRLITILTHSVRPSERRPAVPFFPPYK